MVRKNCAMGSLDMHTMIHCSIIIFFLGGLATMSYYNQDADKNNIEVSLLAATTSSYSNTTTSTKVLDHHLKQMKINNAAPPTHTCDLFSGRWVYDNKSSHYPLYKEAECPYLEDSFACQTYGRKDTNYLQWRWQPHHCDFPGFDSKAVVEKLKGKRVLFVGDSLNRNQYNSMICMLHSSIHGKKKVDGDGGNLHTFRATDHNISIDFYWAPMLVESIGDSPTSHHSNDRVVRMKTIEKHSRHWINADVLVFNSYHWWRSPVVKLAQSVETSLDGPNQVYEQIDYLTAYKMALKAWSKWALTQVDHSKTKMFFMGATPTHSRAKDWRGQYYPNCYGETEPLKEGELVRVTGIDSNMLNILESSLRKLKAKGVNVDIINITQLTQYRKDGHTTVYRKYWRPLTELQIKQPELASDCSHWCLPGVPDIWNELLLAFIFR
uniref:protein trichome birefringence-like 34 n=1 Tax=Erigeron canadensis TaxID=72917 RepID=UPI001CB90982|nr:protein trichome birefringence-like 34 [Erigeron canadensis]